MSLFPDSWFLIAPDSFHWLISASLPASCKEEMVRHVAIVLLFLRNLFKITCCLLWELFLFQQYSSLSAMRLSCERTNRALAHGSSAPLTKPAHSKTNVSPFRIVDLSPYSFNNEIDHCFPLCDSWGLARSGTRALTWISSTLWVAALATPRMQAGVGTLLLECHRALSLPVSFIWPCKNSSWGLQNIWVTLLAPFCFTNTGNWRCLLK